MVDMPMQDIVLLDKTFRMSINASHIQLRIKAMASEINCDLSSHDVVFVAILNGAFMFAADLYKSINFNSRISFVKLASYQASKSSGKVKQLIGLNEDLRDKTVVIVEDIVDTGHTLDTIIRQVKGFQPGEIKISTLLFKPGAYGFSHSIDYIGFSIPNSFIVGYGFDYEGYGRNLDSIYTSID